MDAGAAAPYDSGMRGRPAKSDEMRSRPTPLSLDASRLKPGMRLGAAVSGGADSVALLRALGARRAELGLVLHVVHLHHGLRGEEADRDLAFVRELAAGLGLPFHEARVDTPRQAEQHGESIEEAARRLRYAWFAELIRSTPLDAIATAHTLDDQAETVLAKFLRGAWTEGLSGIHPALVWKDGAILRPMLSATHGEALSYLGELGQAWREDSSNRDRAFTRNRIRHELLPLLETWNPQLRQHLAQMAEVARGEEAWWAAELGRVAPGMVLPGKPARGGGREAGDCLAIDVTRFAAVALAMQRRLLRHAARQLGRPLDFAATEALRTLAVEGRTGQRRELGRGLRGERTPRELRLTAGASRTAGGDGIPEYAGTVPGVVAGAVFGLRLLVERIAAGSKPGADAPHEARLRNWRSGDRVKLRYSSGRKKVKDVLDRLRIAGDARTIWPVLEVDGRIVWMKGAELEPEDGWRVAAQDAAES